MKLIVGLGNPGNEYSKTRHNMGFNILDSYARSHDVGFEKKKFNGLYTIFMFNEEKIILLKPQSFINLSGEVVKAFISYYDIDISDILIISDDLDLPFLKIKFKGNGSSGGHNGLKNIELNLGSDNYKRLKIGISNDKSIDAKDYVLGKLSITENEELQNFFDLSNKALNDYIILPFDRLMNKYN